MTTLPPSGHAAGKKKKASRVGQGPPIARSRTRHRPLNAQARMEVENARWLAASLRSSARWNT